MQPIKLFSWNKNAVIYDDTPSNVFGRKHERNRLFAERHDIHDYEIRNKNKLVIDRVKLESTKKAFFLQRGRYF